MICRNCGAVLSDNSKFCKLCGAKQDINNNVSTENINTTNTYSSTGVETNTRFSFEAVRDNISAIGNSDFFNLLKRLKKNQIITYSLIIFGIVCAFYFAREYVFGPKRIAVKDLITYELSGYNKNGKIRFSMNYDYSLFKEYDDTIAEYNQACVYSDENAKCRNLYQKIYLFDELIDSIDYNTNGKKTELQNGDTIHLAVTVNDELLKAAGYKMPNRSMDVTINGLPEIRTVDLFDGITFAWEYKDYDYTIVGTTRSKDLQKVRYEIGAVNNDGNAKVTVQNQDSLAKDEGILPKDNVLEKEMHVGLKPLHITKPNSSNEEAIKTLFKNRMEKQLKNCNNSFTGTYNVYKVESFEIIKLSETYDGVLVSYKLKTDKGDVDLEAILYKIYLLEDGSYVDNEILDDSYCNIYEQNQ